MSQVTSLPAVLCHSLYSHEGAELVVLPYTTGSDKDSPEMSLPLICVGQCPGPRLLDQLQSPVGRPRLVGGTGKDLDLNFSLMPVLALWFSSL